MEKVGQIPYEKGPERKAGDFWLGKEKGLWKRKSFFLLHDFEKRKSEIRLRHHVNNFSKKKKF